jgi:hypothetical protein
MGSISVSSFHAKFTNTSDSFMRFDVTMPGRRRQADVDLINAFPPRCDVERNGSMNYMTPCKTATNSEASLFDPLVSV